MRGFFFHAVFHAPWRRFSRRFSQWFSRLPWMSSGTRSSHAKVSSPRQGSGREGEQGEVLGSGPGRLRPDRLQSEFCVDFLARVCSGQVLSISKISLLALRFRCSAVPREFLMERQSCLEQGRHIKMICSSHLFQQTFRFRTPSMHTARRLFSSVTVRGKATSGQQHWKDHPRQGSHHRAGQGSHHRADTRALVPGWYTSSK